MILFIGIEKYYKSIRDPFFNAPQSGSLVIELEPGTYEYEMVRNEMLSSIRVHKDDLDEEDEATAAATKEGGVSAPRRCRSYSIVKIEKIKNRKLWARFEHRRKEIQEENGGHENERLLFHGSPYWAKIVERGFDERHACIQGMFGAGIYFAENSSKSNQYLYGLGGGCGCLAHRNKRCCVCVRQLLLCRVCLGKSFCLMAANRLAHAPPGHHSVCGRPSLGGLVYPEYVVYRGEQVSHSQKKKENFSFGIILII
jgi:tankyrase